MPAKTTVLVASAALCACAALVLRMIRKAPEAHEDAKGFHLGSPPAADPRNKPGSKVA